METLYRFRLDTSTGDIEKIAITDYEEKYDVWGKEKYYRYRGKSVWNHVKEYNLDKLCNNSVYTFNPDEERAKDIIIWAIAKKKDEAYNEMTRMIDLLYNIQKEK